MCSLHFTAAWVRRREEGNWWLLNRVQFGCMGEGGGDNFEWMFLGGQGKEENPRWRWVSVERTSLYARAYSLIPCFSRRTLAPVWACWENTISDPPALATFHHPPSYAWHTFFWYICSWCFFLLCPTFCRSVCWMILLLLLSLFRMHFLLKLG